MIYIYIYIYIFYYDIVIRELRDNLYDYKIIKINEDDEEVDYYLSEYYASRAKAFEEAVKKLELIKQEEK